MRVLVRSGARQLNRGLVNRLTDLGASSHDEGAFRRIDDLESFPECKTPHELKQNWNHNKPELTTTLAH